MKKLSALAVFLCLVLCACSALGASANAVVVAPVTHKLTAPFSGQLLPFDLLAGDRVTAGQTLFKMDTVPVYASGEGTVAAVFAKPGDDAQHVLSQYGSLAVIEPDVQRYVAADTRLAYDDDENRTLHAGETLYLKSGSEKGTGMVTSVNGTGYVVRILTGNFELDSTVRCFRASDYANDSETGRGKCMRYADTAVAAQGRITAVHIQPGQRVKTGDLLFEVVDAQAPVGAALSLSSPADGAVSMIFTQSGAQVYRGQLLCEITDLSQLELSVLVDEIDLSRILVGQQLTFTLDAYPAETFTGTVTTIYPLGLQRQNAAYFDVRVTLPGGRSFLPGMNGSAVIPE